MTDLERFCAFIDAAHLMRSAPKRLDNGLVEVEAQWDMAKDVAYCTRQVFVRFEENGTLRDLDFRTYTPASEITGVKLNLPE